MSASQQISLAHPTPTARKSHQPTLSSLNEHQLQPIKPSPHGELLDTLATKGISVMKTLAWQCGLNFDPNNPIGAKPVYKCRYCPRTFSSPCSVGGHVSQTHSKFKAESLGVKDEPLD